MRFILALLMLAGWGMGQEKPAWKFDSNLTVTGRSGMTVIAPLGASETPKTVLTCEPVMDDKGQWTPHVKNCKLDNGVTLDDIVNTMTDLRETERKQFDEERKHWREANDLALKSATLYRSAYQKCIKAVDDFKFYYDSKAHKLTKGVQQ